MKMRNYHKRNGSQNYVLKTLFMLPSSVKSLPGTHINDYDFLKTGMSLCNASLYKSYTILIKKYGENKCACQTKEFCSVRSTIRGSPSFEFRTICSKVVFTFCKHIQFSKAKSSSPFSLQSGPVLAQSLIISWYLDRYRNTWRNQT